MTEDMTFDALNEKGNSGKVGPGKMLKAAREQKKLTKEDVAKHLRLSSQTVKDLELDNYTHISSLVFIRGYLRAYAKYVGVGLDVVMQALDELELEPRVAVTPVKLGLEFQRHARQRGKYIKITGYSLAAIVIILVGFWWKSIASRSDKQTDMVAINRTSVTAVTPATTTPFVDPIPITTTTAGKLDPNTEK